MLETVCGTLSFLTLSLREDSTLVSGALEAVLSLLLLELLFSKLGNQFRCLLVSSFTLGMEVLLEAEEAVAVVEVVEAVLEGVSVFCWKESLRLLTSPVVASAMPFWVVIQPCRMVSLVNSTHSMVASMPVAADTLGFVVLLILSNQGGCTVAAASAINNAIE